MSRSVVASLLVGVLSPWLLAYEYVRTSSWRHRRWLITLFFAFFGSVVLVEFGDGYDHQQDIQKHYVGMSFPQFLDELWRILTFQLAFAKDVYKHVLSYFVGSVINMPQLFFPVVASVYGYFFGGSVLIVLRHYRLSRFNYIVFSLVVVFLFIRGLEGFYTVRTWTGMWILVYSCLGYFSTGERKYLVLMFIPPFVHVGFFLLSIPAWLVLVSGNRPKLYFLLFLASSVTTFLPVEQTAEVLSTTERGRSQVESYLVTEQRDSAEAYSEAREVTNWYNAYQSAGLQRWAPTVLVLAVVLSGIYMNVMNACQKRIFSIGILTLAFSNATWFLYAVHNRSLVIANVFLLAGFLMTRLDPASVAAFRGTPMYYKVGLYVSIALYVPLIIFNLSMTVDWMSIYMFGFPFFVWFDPDVNMSIKEFLRTLLS